MQCSWHMVAAVVHWQIHPSYLRSYRLLSPKLPRTQVLVKHQPPLWSGFALSRFYRQGITHSATRQLHATATGPRFLYMSPNKPHQFAAVPFLPFLKVLPLLWLNLKSKCHQLPLLAHARPFGALENGNIGGRNLWFLVLIPQIGGLLAFATNRDV